MIIAAAGALATASAHPAGGFLIPLAVSQYRLAREVAVPPQRINAVWVSE
jgi:hypothetical protein